MADAAKVDEVFKYLTKGDKYKSPKTITEWMGEKTPATNIAEAFKLLPQYAQGAHDVLGRVANQTFNDAFPNNPPKVQTNPLPMGNRAQPTFDEITRAFHLVNPPQKQESSRGSLPSWMPPDWIPPPPPRQDRPMLVPSYHNFNDTNLVF